MFSNLEFCLWFLLIFYSGFLLDSCYVRCDDETDICQTPDRKDGNCINILNCQPMLDLLRSLKSNPDKYKTALPYICGQPSEFKVCCPIGPIIPDEDIVHDEAADVTNHRNINLLPKDCGSSHSHSTFRIVNGENATFNEFPWMALLQYNSSRGPRFMCGGTIINSNYILTAAHCLGPNHAQLASVRVGEYSIKDIEDCEMEITDFFVPKLKCNPPVQDLTVEKIILHPRFKNENINKNIADDIALVRVSRIQEAENVRPVCLPVGELRDAIYQYVHVTGWGVSDYIKQETADILQKIKIPVANNLTCFKSYSEAGILLRKTQICAGGADGKDACSGDSGGPMMAVIADNRKVTYVQQGIVSFGPRFCGIEGYPGVYTLVKYYMDWILDNMEP